MPSTKLALDETDGISPPVPHLVWNPRRPDARWVTLARQARETLRSHLSVREPIEAITTSQPAHNVLLGFTVALFGMARQTTPAPYLVPANLLSTTTSLKLVTTTATGRDLGLAVISDDPGKFSVSKFVEACPEALQ